MRARPRAAGASSSRCPPDPRRHCRRSTRGARGARHARRAYRRHRRSRNGRQRPRGNTGNPRDAPRPHVLVLTTYADDASLFPALQAGARGYLTKDASAEEIEQAIRAVADGRTHLDPAVQERLVAAALDPPAAPASGDGQPLPVDLPPREAEVSQL